MVTGADLLGVYAYTVDGDLGVSGTVQLYPGRVCSMAALPDLTLYELTVSGRLPRQRPGSGSDV